MKFRWQPQGLNSDEVRKEIGRSRYYELRLTIDRLYDPEVEVSFRIAPSIIARSELELLGLGEPRFGIRASLFDGDRQLGFVNLRKIKSTWRQRSTWYYPEGSVRQTPKQTWWSLLLELFRSNTDLLEFDSPSDVVWDASPIADCLLELPSKFFKKGYESIKVNLGVAYGETLSDDTPLVGTPFMRHIPCSGGGLCAQAVCFMATALMFRFATNIYGLAEITKLATGVKGDEMVITGLYPRAISKYFSEVGLRASIQSTGKVRNEDTLLPALNTFNLALRACVRSKCPVIVMVDGGRMAGDFLDVSSDEQCILERNGLQLPPKTPQGEPGEARNHAVLIVGFGGQDQFLVNDPATEPFLEANVRQLSDAAMYQSSRGKRLAEIRRHLCLPVTPSAVKSTLLDVTHADPSQVVAEGLMTRVRLVRSLIPFSTDPGQVDPEIASLPEVHATEQFESIELVQIEALSEYEPINGNENWEDIEKLLAQRCDEWGWDSRHWIWIERIQGTLWIWDAERELPALEKVTAETWDERSAFLRQVFELKNLRWREVCCFPPECEDAADQSADSGQPSVHDDHRIEEFGQDGSVIEGRAPIGEENAIAELEGIESALISSCSLESLTNYGTLLNEISPATAKNIDFYTFLRRDGDRYLLSKSRQTVRELWFYAWKFGDGALSIIDRFAKFNTSRFFRRRFMKRAVKLWHCIRTWYTAGSLGAQIAQTAKSPKQLAEEISSAIEGRKIVALSTFVPGISAPDNDPVRRAARAVEELEYLAQFAVALKALGHPVRVMEIVAGTVIDGLYPEESDSGKRDFIARLTPRETVLKRVLENLVPVAETLARASSEQGQESPLLALELEPGPLYVLEGSKGSPCFQKPYLISIIRV